MDPKVASILFRILGAAAQIEADGLTAELKAKLTALVDEAGDSILEPQENGQPWTREAILAKAAEHDALTAELRARHSNG